jgi:hypothetical protein
MAHRIHREGSTIQRSATIEDSGHRRLLEQIRCDNGGLASLPDQAAGGPAQHLGQFIGIPTDLACGNTQRRGALGCQRAAPCGSCLDGRMNGLIDGCGDRVSSVGNSRL